MATLKIYDMKAKEIGTKELSDQIFGVEYNEALVHEAVVAYLANQRQGNKSTLTRSEVRGHAKKPYGQKGTGNARQGSTKGPQFRGGGVVFAPKPRDFSKKMNKVAKRIAFLSALGQKIAQNQVVIVDKFDIKSGKTKDAQKFMDAFKYDDSTLIIDKVADEMVLRATANIADLNVTDISLVNTYDIVANKNIVFTSDAIKTIEEAQE